MLAEVMVRELLVAIGLSGQPAMWYKDCNGNGIMSCVRNSSTGGGSRSWWRSHFMPSPPPPYVAL